MLVSSGMAVVQAQKTKGGMNGDMSYLFVLGHIYLCGVREAEGIENGLSRLLSPCYKTFNSLCTRLTFPTCHSAVRPLTCALVRALAWVHLSKAGNGCLFWWARPVLPTVKHQEQCLKTRTKKLLLHLHVYFFYTYITFIEIIQEMFKH